MNLEERVLDKIAPTEEEERTIHEMVEELRAKMHNESAAYNLTVDVKLVGSIAKGTYLRGSLDIDMFILYPPSMSRENIKRFTLNIGKTVLKNWIVQYAEHPYIRGKYGPYDVDIVPCYNVRDTMHMQSAVDRTPFHTDFIKEHLTIKQRNQVRLLKQFLKGIGCYGAKVSVQGFSGYLAELLVLNYTDFYGVLNSALEWSGEEIIALEESSQRETFDESFVFIDPVDPSRNVAAALSEKKRQLFVQAAEAYSKIPDIRFFFPQQITPWPLEDIASKLNNIIGIELPHPNVIDDIVYSQAIKGVKNLAGLFREYEFHVRDTPVHVNTHILLTVSLNSLELSSTTIHRGPLIQQQEHSDAFIKKWQKNDRVVCEPFIKKQRWWVEIERPYTSARKLLKENLFDVNLGNHLNKLKDQVKILSGKQLANSRYATFWTDYLSKTPPWQR